MIRTLLEKKQDQKPNRNWQIPFDSIVEDPEGVYRLGEAPPESNHQFEFENLRVHMHLSREGESRHLHLWSEVCNMPYTAESPTKRSDAIRVLNATKSLKHVRFAVAENQRILSMYEIKFDEIATLDIVISEIIFFAQEALPFVRLLRQL